MTRQAATYLFYDLETTGINPCFDQVLQFAAIRTDLSLNEIERHEIRIKLNADIMPSPHAMITHRIDWQTMQTGDSEYQAMQRIHQLLNTPGTISVGYNSLGFDDEFLRFSFYRNLLPPYTHQYANQCGRMDILPITTLYYLYKPDIVQWPMIEGVRRLKLEGLNACNHWVDGVSHDALVDVEVTIALAKELYREKALWDYAVGFFQKATDSARLHQLSTGIANDSTQYPQGILTSLRCGYAKQLQQPVLGLGQHRHYKNQTLWLALDQTELQQATLDNFTDKTRVIRKKVAEAPIILPTKQRFLDRLDPDRLQVMQANLAWLETQPDLLQTLCDYYLEQTYPIVEHIDCDAALYQIGFPSREEEQLFQQFHQVPPDKKWQVAQRFPNAIRQQQAVRILQRNFNHAFTNTEQDTTFSAKTQDYRCSKKYTQQDALNDIKSIDQSTLDDQQRSLLQELQQQLLAVETSNHEE
ncbi:MAG: exodeoxyribonuclease I [Coxiellaceae bacterium]|nr:exodeoxyribonuclease I [Coxiellaceae bacterium]|tara:strand:- start:272 stop:1684 length:1413 start_codon:yes stop_codon:yes gene_type:complete